MRIEACHNCTTLTMFRVPAIGTAVVVGEGRLKSLQGDIGTAHDCLAHVVETVDHVPVVIVGYGMIGFETRVSLDHCELRGKELVKVCSSSARNRVAGCHGRSKEGTPDEYNDGRRSPGNAIDVSQMW